MLFNIRSSFTAQNPRTRLVKIDHVCFFLPGNDESFECVITITHEKCAVLKMARSKTSRNLYLQVDKANKLMKISMNSTIKTKKENNLENFYRQRQLNLVDTDYSHFFVCKLSHESSLNRRFFYLSLCLFARLNL